MRKFKFKIEKTTSEEKVEGIIGWSVVILLIWLLTKL